MDISVNAEVHCADGLCGHSIYIILNPVTERVTHLVVKEKQFPHTERLVPIDLVMETTPNRIQLRCTGRELTKMDPFIETEFIQTELPEYESAPYPYQIWPYVTPEVSVIPLEHERIPAGELAVRRGAHVEATDGYVGRVDEFLVDPTDEHVTQSFNHRANPGLRRPARTVLAVRLLWPGVSDRLGGALGRAPLTLAAVQLVVCLAGPAPGPPVAPGRSAHMAALNPAHWQVITPVMRDLLRFVGGQPFAERFYLAGGTALALRPGHRLSVDLDFFSVTDEVTRPTRQEILTALVPLSPQALEDVDGNPLLEVSGLHVGF